MRYIAYLLTAVVFATTSFTATANNEQDAARADFSGRAGHFYTIVGYEVATTPSNFFYSQADGSYAMPARFGVFIEPFTHTGALATDAGSGNRIEYYGGWTTGWDTGHESFLGATPGATFDRSNPIGSAYLIKDYLWIDARSADVPTGGGDPANDAQFREFEAALEYRSNLSLPYSRIRSSSSVYEGTTLLIGDRTYGIEGGFRRFRDPVEMPLLAKIPTLCQFFVGQVYENERNHLMVLVTPQLVDPIDCE
jgi:hypothetical protein